jgi:hopanoid biosynthesis associated RND transporter like protein HpnN
MAARIEQSTEATVPPLDRFLCSWARAAQGHAVPVLLFILSATVGLGAYAATHLGFNVDPNSFFSQDLRFQRAIRDFEQYFPVLTNSLLVVVDTETPEMTRRAGEQLVLALDEQRDVYHRAFQPGNDRFFERFGLLYASLDELDDFADHMATVQPVLGELARDMSLPTLTRVIQLGLEQEHSETRDVESWQSVLQHFREALDGVRSGDDRSLSWERLLLEGSGFEPSTRSVIIADPILDLDRILAAERGIDTVRETAKRLELTPENGVLIRITGYPAVNHEEMIGVSRDTSIAGGLAFVLVVLVLAAAFRSWQLVLASAITLVVGLIWAAAFAAAAVREMNPMSITFGILVIGLGIDFMIHMGMHFVDRIVNGECVEAAVVGSIADTGRALVLCAGTTSVGFLAFVPTDFTGISDLGLATVGGMISILLLTLTLLPALIKLLMTPRACERLKDRGRGLEFRILQPSNPVAVVVVASVVGAVALPLLPYVDLDTNVISFRNQETESVQTFRDLLDSQRTTPWYLDALAPSLDRAVELAEAMRELPEVDLVYTLADFIPEQQEEKIEILSDIAMMLYLPEHVNRVPASGETQTTALRKFADFLHSEPAASDSTLAAEVSGLGESLDAFLAAQQQEGGSRLVNRLALALLDPLPEQIERLNANLDVSRIGREDLPETLVERMISPDGHARIQVYPSGDLWNQDEMIDFVESIRVIWKEITGLPVNLVESARATWQSLRSALIGAILAITLLLLALWRSPSNMAIVLGPLLLAALLAQSSTVVLPISINFANVIVLPLLLGIGVDSGIHLVQRANAPGTTTTSLLESTTARAVVYSALTTIASFGTLAISNHNGTSSLGWLLTVGMIFTLLANLVLLPALLALRSRL